MGIALTPLDGFSDAPEPGYDLAQDHRRCCLPRDSRPRPGRRLQPDRDGRWASSERPVDRRPCHGHRDPTGPDELRPAGPDELRPAGPDELCPAAPDELCPAGPDELCPAAPDGLCPADPDEL